MKRYANYYKMFVNGEYNGTVKALTKKDALEIAKGYYTDKNNVSVEKINKIHNKYLVILVHPETDAQVGIYVDRTNGYFTAEVFKKFSDRDKEIVMARDFDDDLDYFVEKVQQNDILSDYLIKKYGKIHENKQTVSEKDIKIAQAFADLVAKYSTKQQQEGTL